ncbi:MAG: Na(+)-translocating NADH-quinone reductase subunit C [Myxococcota bacterium]|nr:Na(+)-translocating NADH-quinone reductase subunit C [Myxococcota bacterium]
MQQRSAASIVTFAAVLCLVCGLLVAASAVALRPLQKENKILDRQKKVLIVAGLMTNDDDKTPEEIKQLFNDNIEARVVDLKTGQYNDKIDIKSFDQRKAAKEITMSRTVPTNKAGVLRVPNSAMVYIKRDGDKVDRLILPVEGKGLWSTLYGYIALANDANTIKGLIFYEHMETPGLGGEIENPLWTRLWPGKKVFDTTADGQPTATAKIEVVKGQAQPGNEYQVDGLSGATITSRGVTYLVQFWLADQFAPYLKAFRAKGERS